MEPFGRLPLEAGGMSGVGTRRGLQVSAEYWEFEPIPRPLRPRWTCAVSKTLTHMLPLVFGRRTSAAGLDAHVASLLDRGYPSFPLQFQRRHRLNLLLPSDRDVPNEARLMPIYESAASYRPIMLAQWGDFHPASDSHDGNINTAPVVSKAPRMNLAAR